MDRALVYLLGMRVKNTVRSLMRRRIRLLGIVLLVALFVGMAVSGQRSRGMDVMTRQAILSSVLGLYLLLAVFGGLGEPGLGFKPADMDYVLPAPFRRRDVLAYHLMRHYGQIVVLGLIYSVFLGAAGMPNPVLAYVGIVLCLAVAVHLQSATTLVASTVGDRVYSRMRAISRGGLIALLVLAAGVALVGVAGTGDVPGLLNRILGSPVARVLLYPAAAAGRLGAATSWVQASPSLLGLGACVVASFGLVLLFPVNFMETAYTTAERRKKDHAGPNVKESRRTHALPGFLRGAGSIVWLNALTLQRRLRMVVGLIAVLLIILLISGARAATRTESEFPTLLAVLALFPLIANLPLGFRGHREHLELFKTLPFSPTRMALSQVTVPVLLIWVTQSVVLVLFFAMGRLTPFWTVAAIVALPLVDLGVVALADLFQMGRERRHLGFLGITLQMLAIAATALPAMVGGTVAYDLTQSHLAGLGAALALHAAVVAGILRLLGWRFATFEPGQDDV